jgi:RNA 2',3'-cyclic 3'-phosphodiesterase
MNEAGSLRLFFALWFDVAQRRHLQNATTAYLRRVGGKSVLAANYHVTLAFIGSVPEEQLPLIRAAGTGAAAAAGLRGSITLRAYEYWPKPEVVVAACRDTAEPFDRLWHDLHRQLGAVGLALNPKSWRPHVTLARGVAVEPPRQELAPIELKFDQLTLLRSHTGGAESRYTVVDHWPLLDKPSD